MIDAPKPTVLILPALAALLVLGACTGDAGGDTPRRAGAQTAQNGAPAQANGDVLIAAPTAPYTVAPLATSGSVTGTVSLSRPLPQLDAARTGADSATCGESIVDESLSVQQSGAGVAGVLIWIEGIRAGKPLPSERRRELESTHCRLAPRVQAAVVGSAVNVITHDNFRQQLQFSAAGESASRARIPLGGGEQVIPTELPTKAPGLLTVVDANHPWPRAFIAVFDHPYFAITAPDGSFAIDGVPPGTYTLRAWHERARLAEQRVAISGTAVTVKVVLEGK